MRRARPERVRWSRVRTSATATAAVPCDRRRLTVGVIDVQLDRNRTRPEPECDEADRIRQRQTTPMQPPPSGERTGGEQSGSDASEQQHETSLSRAVVGVTRCAGRKRCGSAGNDVVKRLHGSTQLVLRM
jgi:hypothetical protein